MNKEYDEIISQHYKNIAKEQGLLSTSTMSDEMTRDMETEAILHFVDESLRYYREIGFKNQITIMDVGCGNGYTLDQLAKKYPNCSFVGVEKSDELRGLAVSRFHKKDNVKILEGDLRDSNFSNGITADILICQRVLINLLSLDDQNAALGNIISAVRPSKENTNGGTLLFIESFINPLTRLNEARKEFDLLPVLPAQYNLYLPDDFFEINKLITFKKDDQPLIPSNFLSTHYYVTRVLHEIVTPKNKEFKRNSEFVKFFSTALNQFAGDYSPLKIHMFQKIV